MNYKPLVFNPTGTKRTVKIQEALCILQELREAGLADWYYREINKWNSIVKPIRDLR